MPIVVANRTAQSGTYYTGSPNYVDVSAGAAAAGMVTFPAKATDASWADGVEIGVAVVKDDDNWQVWRATWDATNEYLEVVEVEDSDGSLSDSDSVTVTATLTEAHVQKIINGREVLTGNRTYYVRTDGSDSNDGLTNSSGGAFLTIQKAIDVTSALDGSIYDITIQVGNGTYSLSSSITLKPSIGSGTTYIIGNTSTPSNVILSTTSLYCFNAAIPGKTFDISGFKLQGSGSLVAIASAIAGSKLKVGNLEFSSGFAMYHLFASDGGSIEVVENYTILSGTTAHWNVQNCGLIRCQNKTITLTGAPAFTQFAQCERFSVLTINGNTFSGSGTGIRYNCMLNSVMWVGGAGASYLPGNSAGTTATGGQYA